MSFDPSQFVPDSGSLLEGATGAGNVPSNIQAARDAISAKMRLDEQSRPELEGGVGPVDARLAAKEPVKKKGGFDPSQFVPDQSAKFDPQHFQPDSSSTEPDTYEGQPQPDQPGYSISQGGQQLLNSPTAGVLDKVVGNAKITAGEIGQKLGDLRKQPDFNLAGAGAWALTGGAALGMGDIVGSLAERFGGLLNGDAVQYAAKFKQEHPEASMTDVLAALFASPTLTSDAVKAIRDKLPKSPSAEFGEEAIGAPFTVAREAVGRTLEQTTGSQSLGQIGRSLMDIVSLAAPKVGNKAMEARRSPAKAPKSGGTGGGSFLNPDTSPSPGIPENAGFEPYTPDLLMGMGEEQIRQNPYNVPEGLPTDENGHPYNPELSGDVVRNGETDLFNAKPYEVPPKANAPDVLKQAEMEHDWKAKEYTPEADQLWQEQEWERLKNNVEAGIESNPTNDMTLAFQKARSQVNSTPLNLMDRKMLEMLKNLRGSSDTELEHMARWIRENKLVNEFEDMGSDYYGDAFTKIGNEQQRRVAEQMKGDLDARIAALPHKYTKGDVVMTEEGRTTILRRLEGEGNRYIATRNGQQVTIHEADITGKAGPHGTVSSMPFLDPDYWKNLSSFLRGNESDLWNPDGRGRVLYHATNAEISEHQPLGFDIPRTKNSEMGFHVGDRGQANTRFATGADIGLTTDANQRIMPVHISAKNPFRMMDAGSFNWARVAREAAAKKIITMQELQHIMEDANARVDAGVGSEEIATQAVQNAFKRAGYDSIKYLNRYEGVKLDANLNFDHVPKEVLNQIIQNHAEGLMQDKFNGLKDSSSARALADIVRKEGTDAEFRALFPEAGTAWILFDPQQVKSAIGNAGSFNPMDPSILRSMGPELFKKLGDNIFTRLIFGGAAPDMRFDVIPGLVEKFGKPETWKDTKALVGMTTASHRAKNALIWALRRNDQSIPTAMLESFVDNHMQQLIAQAHAVNTSVKPVFDTLFKQYGVDKLFRDKSKLQNYSKDMKVLLDMERDPSAWFDGQNYYWTKDQLVEHGIPEERAQAWADMGRAYNDLWGILGDAMQMTGKPMPKRVAGWLPHSISGPYRMIVDIDMGNGNVQHYVNMGAYSRKSAQQMMTFAKSELGTHPQFGQMTFKVEDPHPEGHSIAALTEGMYSAMGMLEQNKALSSLVKKIYQNAEQGIIREALDRSHSTMLGHDLQRVMEYGKDNPLGLTSQQMAKTLTGLYKAYEDVTGYKMRVQYVNHVLFPLLDAGFMTSDKFGGFASNIKTRTNAFLKINDVLEQSINNRIKGMLISYGLNPGLLSQSARGTMSLVSKSLLWANPKFWVANLFQSTYLAGMLQTYKALGMATGERTGSITKTMADAAKDLAAIPLMERGRSSILDWAVDHGYTDFAYTELMDPGKLKDRVSMGIEARTRAAAFVATYHYFKQFMSHEEALEAAGGRANQIGVSYNSQFGGPTWFNQMQWVERPLALFQTFTAHQFGMLNQQLGVAALALKKGDMSIGNAKGFLTAVRGIATFQAVQYALFGMAGVYFASNWDAVTKLLNKLGGWDIPTTQDMARKLDAMIPKQLQGINTFGLLSKATGWDIGTSGQGLNFRTPDVVPKYLEMLGTWAVLGMRWAGQEAGVTHKRITAMEMKEAIDQLPSSVREFAMFGAKHDGFKDIVPTLLGEKSDWSAQPNVGIDKGRQRSYTESLMALVLGIQSIDEKSFQQGQQIDARKQKVIDETIESIVQKAKEHKQLSKDDIANIMWATRNSGKDLGAILDSIINAQLEKNYDPDLKRGLDGSASLEAQRKYELYRRERQLNLQQR